MASHTEAVKRIAREAIDEHGAQQKLSELAQLLGFLIERKPRRVLEVGTYAGGTLWAMRCVCPGAVMVAIDTFESSSVDADVFIEADSTSEDATRHAAQAGPYDFIFVDGDHHYDGALSDWCLYSPMVRVGGTIGFHDIVDHGIADVGVHRLWGEIKSCHIVLEFIEEGDAWGGIGIVIL